MRHHIERVKCATTDRLHNYCCVKYPSYAAWHEHPYHSHTHWFLLVVFFVGWVMGLFFQLHFFPITFIRAAAFTFNQASWATGATANNANHTSNRTGWTEFSSKDTDLTAGATLTLTQQSTTFSEDFTATTYKDTTNTTADWQTGSGGQVQLDKTYLGTPTYKDLTGDGNGVHVVGSYAYMAMGSGGLVIVDLNNTNNTYTRTFPNLSSPVAQGVYVTGNYAYVALRYGTSSGALAVVDVTDPTNPGTPVYETLNGNAFDVFVSGNYAYLAVNTAGLDIVDVTDKSNPAAPVNKDTTNGCAQAVIVSGSYAYVGTTTVGCTGATASTLEIFDVSTPTSPGNPVAKSGIEATRGRISRANNYVYIPTSSGVQSVDTTTPTSPGTIYTFSAPGVGRGAYASGSYVYLANNAGVTLYDATTPTSLSLLSTRTLKTRGQDVFFLSNKAYVAYGQASAGDGLAILDSTPDAYNTPRVVQSLTVDTTTQAIRTATLTATHTLNGQTISYQLSRDGGTTWEDVTSGQEYTFTSSQAEQSDLRWKATLSTTNTAQTPTLSDISLIYTFYPASQTLTSSAFNTEASTTQLTQIAWSETLPSGTNVRFQARTAPDSSGSPGTWGNWLGPTSTSDYYETTAAGETINTIQADSSNDQWMQYRVLLTSTGLNTPTLSSVTISYSTLPGNPSISSSTHSSETTYYPSTTPSITVSAATPTPDHYHYLVNQTASPTIAQVAAGTQVAGSFTVPGGSITSDGTWYIHVVAQDSSHANSASFASLTTKIDATAPTSTTLSFGSIAATSITVSGSATDATAGLHATPFYFERDSGAANSGWISGSWTDSGLSVNTQYNYRVKSRDGAATPNESSFTANQAKYTGANTPNAPSVTSPTSSSVTVTIATNSNPTGGTPAGDTQYVIAASTDNFATNTSYVQSDGTLGASEVWRTYSQWGGASGVTVTGLTANTTYTFKVKARNGDNTETAYGSSSSGYTASGAPVNFRATVIDTTSVTVAVDRFNGDTIGQAGYYFSRTGANSGWSQTNSWGDTGLTPNTTYTYSAKTRNSNAEESVTSSLDVTTLAAAPGAPSINTDTRTQSTLTVILASSTNPSSTEYAIQETTQNKYVQASGALADAVKWQSYTNWGGASGIPVINLTDNTTYTFRVKARNSAAVETAFSSSTSGTTLALATPTAPSIDSASRTQTSLKVILAASGNPPSTEYAIQETTQNKYLQTNGTLGNVAAWQTYAAWGSATGTTVTGLTENTTYTFRVKARGSSGNETAFGGSTSGTTLAQGVPRAPSIPDSGRTATSLTVVVDATGFGSGVEFAIQETGGQYVQSNGTLGAAAAWRTYSQWGGSSGVVVTGLTSNTTYGFKVQSRDANTGNVASAFGPTTSATTTGTGTGQTDRTPPTLPAITPEVTTDSAVRLSWRDPPESDFFRVVIYRSDTNAPPSGTPYSIVLRGFGYFRDPAVEQGRTYKYQLRFEDEAGNGVVSDVIRITVPSRPPEPPPEPPTGGGSGALNIKELIRIQNPAILPLVIENVPGLEFLLEKLVPSRERQETFRTRVRTVRTPRGTTARIIGRFGLLYDVVPKGFVAGARLPQPVRITVRYRTRDAALILRSARTHLAFAYYNGTTQEWEIVDDAVQDIVNGTFSAAVSRAGIYGIVITTETGGP